MEPLNDCLKMDIGHGPIVVFDGHCPFCRKRITSRKIDIRTATPESVCESARIDGEELVRHIEAEHPE